jgi:hypothetical protein
MFIFIIISLYYNLYKGVPCIFVKSDEKIVDITVKEPGGTWIFSDFSRFFQTPLIPAVAFLFLPVVLLYNERLIFLVV